MEMKKGRIRLLPWTRVVFVGGEIGWFFGEQDGFFYVLLAFVVID